MYIGEHGEYASGGYVYDFRGSLTNLKGNLSELHRLSWIDDRTRAIIIQMSLYNPNIRMFTSGTLLAEFLTTGSVIPTARFEPLDFESKSTRTESRRSSHLRLLCLDLDFSSLFHLMLAIAYLIVIGYLMIEEMRSVRRLKWIYFRQFWSYIQWGIIVCSWLTFAIYLWRHQEMQRIGTRFQTSKGDVYINLQLATYVNDMLTFLLGFCCFFSTIKLLRFARYTQHLSLFGDTIHHARKDLVSFTCSFFIMFLAFLFLFYSLFASKMWACSNLLHTAQMLFEMILMKFDASELTSADAFLGPLCFVVFIFFVVFIGMTMFISIIGDSFRIVQQNHRMNHDEEHDMFAFIWYTFQRWIGRLFRTVLILPTIDYSYLGIRKCNESDQRNKQMRSEYRDPIEDFPAKIDQLLEALNRVAIHSKSLL
jgi:Polycystin cation channel